MVEENRVYITQQHQEEEDTASMIARKLHERIPVLTIEKELEEAQEDLNITLSEQQKKQYVWFLQTRSALLLEDLEPEKQRF